MNNAKRLLLLAVVVAAAAVFPAPDLSACSRYFITNRDYCGSESCPVVICTLSGQDAANCYYTC